MADSDATYKATTDFLQAHAREALMEAGNATRRISAQVKPSLDAPSVDVDLTKPNLEAPPVFSDLFPDADGTAPEVDRLNSMVDEWISDYFPAINDCFRTVPDQWLCDVISGVKPFGMDRSVLELVWQQGRDQEARMFRTDEAELRAQFSERGFSLPPGAYVRSVERIKQRGEEAVLELNRGEIIRQEEVKVQMIQFAVQQATQYKMAIMSALADFYRVWVTVPDRDIERARVRAQAYSSLYSALSAYYGVEIAFEELKLRAELGEAEVGISNDRNRISLFDSDNAASALGNAVRGFAQVSGDAANAAGSLIAQIEAL